MAVENPFDQKTLWQATNEIAGIRALHDHVIVRDMSFDGRQLASGIVLLGDDGKTDGIRPRWAQVYAVGPDQQDISVNQWVLIEHGRWTRGLKVAIEGEEFVIRRADPNGIIFAQDQQPESMETVSTAVHAERKRREQYE
jgi:co-chaperonin GroES (HSP10)